MNQIALRLHEIALTLEGTNMPEVVAAIEIAEREINRLHGALQMIAEETIVPDAFPDTWDSYSEDQQLHISALLIAQGALEGSADNGTEPR